MGAEIDEDRKNQEERRRKLERMKSASKRVAP